MMIRIGAAINTIQQRLTESKRETSGERARNVDANVDYRVREHYASSPASIMLPLSIVNLSVYRSINHSINQYASIYMPALILYVCTYAQGGTICMRGLKGGLKGGTNPDVRLNMHACSHCVCVD